MIEALTDRLRRAVTVTDAGCWEWQRTLDRCGYGRVWIGSRTDGSRRQVPAHRAAYEAFVGPIDRGRQIDHLCRNRSCINPAHLEPVTAHENLMRSPLVPASINAAKTECKRGHEFTAENTWTDKRGKRYCRACRKVRATA